MDISSKLREDGMLTEDKLSEGEEREFFQFCLPRSDNLDGSGLKIELKYTEAGMFCEANCITVSDAEGRKAIYAPFAVFPRVKEWDEGPKA